MSDAHYIVMLLLGFKCVKHESVLYVSCSVKPLHVCILCEIASLIRASGSGRAARAIALPHFRLK